MSSITGEILHARYWPRVLTDEEMRLLSSGNRSRNWFGSVFRFQDSDGRGPFRPGFSKYWIDDDGPCLLPPYTEEFGVAIVGAMHATKMHCGCGCRTLEQLNKWFTPSEQRKLRNFGYSIVSIDIDRVIAESENQVVFARRKPLRIGAVPVPEFSNADATKRKHR